SLIRSMNVYDFIFSCDELAFINEKQAKELETVSVRNNDILLNITGVSVARCCKVPQFILPARVNQHVMLIRPENEYYLSHYLLCLLCYSENKAKLLGISQSGSTREALTKVEIEELKIIKPLTKTLKLFDDNLVAMINFIEFKILENLKLTEMKNLLLSKLATIEN
ncbi:MAG: hypothetical protein WBP33_16460, partial [Saprospiraceae bacterium]